MALYCFWLAADTSTCCSAAESAACALATCASVSRSLASASSSSCCASKPFCCSLACFLRAAYGGVGAAELRRQLRNFENRKRLTLLHVIAHVDVDLPDVPGYLGVHL